MDSDDQINEVGDTTSSCNSTENSNTASVTCPTDEDQLDYKNFTYYHNINLEERSVIHSDIIYKVWEYMKDKSPPVLRSSWSESAGRERIPLHRTISSITENDSDDENTSSSILRSQTTWFTNSTDLLQEPPPDIQVYKKSRFWVLTLFSLLLLYQDFAWSTWGPLSKAAKYAFEWKEYMVSELAGWVPITFMICVVPATWMIEHWGMRIVVIFATLLGAVGRLLCCVNMNPEIFEILVQIGAILTGVMGTIAVATLTVPVMWFSPKHKLKTTAIVVMASHIGSWISYLMPLVISQPKSATREEIRNEIQILMIAELSVVAVLFIAVVVYFPSRPNNNNITNNDTNTQTLTHREIFLMLASRWGFWAVILSYGIFTGVARAWIYVASSVLHDIGVNQKELISLGGSMIVTLVLTTIIVGWVADLRNHGVRNSILLLVIVCTLAYLWLILLTARAIQFSNVQVYIAMILIQCSNIATIPLFYDWASSVGHPCSETVVGAFMSCANNFVTTLCSFSFFTSGIDKEDVYWITYVLLGSCLAPIPPLVFLHQDPSNVLPPAYLHRSQDLQSRHSSMVESICNDGPQVENYM